MARRHLGRPALPILVEYFCDRVWRQLIDHDHDGRLELSEMETLFAEVDAMLRKEIPPVFVPEQHDDPLRHFPDQLTTEVVEKADFQSPAQLARSPSRDEFPLFDYRRSRDDLAEPEPEPEATVAPPAPALEWPPEAIQFMPQGEQEEP